MDLLVVRHGDAVEDAPSLGDGGRWLTGKGRSVTRRVAQWLVATQRWRPSELWSSPLVRAVQTAEILANAAELVETVSVLGALSTSGDPREVLRQMGRYRGEGPLCIVGHEPNLSSIALALLGEVAWPGFKKSGALALQWDGSTPGAAKLHFLLDPKEMQTMTELPRVK